MVTEDYIKDELNKIFKEEGAWVYVDRVSFCESYKLAIFIESYKDHDYSNVGVGIFVNYDTIDHKFYSMWSLGDSRFNDMKLIIDKMKIAQSTVTRANAFVEDILSDMISEQEYAMSLYTDMKVV